MNYHRLFEKNVFLFFAKSAKKCKKSKRYFTCISIKIDSISKTFFTEMISTKSSTNPESFIKFGRGRRIGWRLHMDTPIYERCVKFEFNFRVDKVTFPLLLRICFYELKKDKEDEQIIN
jgi:hypothetical protein